MVATVKAKPVERINGLTSNNEGDRVGEKPIATRGRGDCFKCSGVFLPSIDAEAGRDLAKRSPKKIKFGTKKFGKKSIIFGKKSLKTFGKKSKKGGKKAKKGFKKSSPFLKKGTKKAFKIGKKGLKKSAPLSIPAGGVAIPAGGTFAAFGAPAFGIGGGGGGGGLGLGALQLGGQLGGFDGFLGGTGADAAFDTFVFGADQ